MWIPRGGNDVSAYASVLRSTDSFVYSNWSELARFGMRIHWVWMLTREPYFGKKNVN